jgi:hypothetical protein
MSLSGSWTLTMQTPMGLQTFTFFAKVESTLLTGTIANGADEPIAISDGIVEGFAASWKLTVKKPMPMTLAFSATEDSNSLAGTAKAGPFPAVTFSGVRIT